MILVCVFHINCLHFWPFWNTISYSLHWLFWSRDAVYNPNICFWNSREESKNRLLKFQRGLEEQASEVLEMTRRLLYTAVSLNTDFKTHELVNCSRLSPFRLRSRDHDHHLQNPGLPETKRKQRDQRLPGYRTSIKLFCFLGKTNYCTSWASLTIFASWARLLIVLLGQNCIISSKVCQ